MSDKFTEKEWWDRFSQIVAYQCQLNPRLNEIVQGGLEKDYTEFLYKKGGKLLDVGCGIGSVSLHFTRLGMRVTGIDFSPEQIKQANKVKKKCNLKNINFLCRDISTEIQGQFDSIIISAVLHHLGEAEIEETMNGIGKLLKPKGRVYIYEPFQVHKRFTFLTLFYLFIGVALYSIYGFQKTCGMLRKEYLNARREGYTGGSPAEVPILISLILENVPKEVIVKEIRPWHLFSLMYAMKTTLLKPPYQKFFMKFVGLIYALDKALFRIFSQESIPEQFPLLCGIKLQKI